MGVIQTSFAALQRNYPRRDQKNPELYKYVEQAMTGLPGTPCCVQMSHALNMAGIIIPRMSYRRQNTALKIKGTTYYYLLATDEMEDFLFNCCRDNGELVNLDFNKARPRAEIQKHIAGQPGLLVFRHEKFHIPPTEGHFEHTELWDGTKILQRDMAEGSLFSSARVLMWYANDPAQFLVDYMKTQP